MADGINWKKLRGQYGPAGMVPELVDCITEEVRSVLEPWSAYRDLTESVLRPGVWVTASAPTVDRLLKCSRDKLGFAFALNLAADITAGVGLDYWVRCRRREVPHQYQIDCWRLVVEHADKILGSLNDERAMVRGAAAHLLSNTPPLGDRSQRALEARWNLEAVGITRACILQALDDLDESGRWEAIAHRATLQGTEEAPVLGLAWLIHLRRHPGEMNRGLVQGLESWLRLPVDAINQTSGSTLELRGRTDQILAALLAAQLGDHPHWVRDLLVQLVNRPHSRRSASFLASTIDAVLGIAPEDGGFPKIDPAKCPSFEQRELAQELLRGTNPYRRGLALCASALSHAAQWVGSGSNAKGRGSDR
jgi:hypothetical protein